ncbi:MAG TPA: SH3 domain-containing protein [Myxococcaceae bacterium]|nr:SH3 domain-containing protein [Myxococcaceae bacterium]
MISLLLSAVLAQAPAYYSPTEAEAVFNASNDAYAREDYAKAKEGFEKLVGHGFGSADVLYNLGTTDLAMGDLGGAVLALERARREGGPREDIEANLALARTRQLDKVVGGQTEEPFLERLALATPESASAVALLSLWSLGFLSLAARRLLPSRRRGMAVAVCALSFVFAAPVAGAVAAHVYVRRGLDEGVVLAQSLSARELPREGGKVSFEVHAGLKVLMLEESGKFVRIRLPNGLEGWTEREGVGAL